MKWLCNFVICLMPRRKSNLIFDTCLNRPWMHIICNLHHPLLMYLCEQLWLQGSVDWHCASRHNLMLSKTFSIQSVYCSVVPLHAANYQAWCSRVLGWSKHRALFTLSLGVLLLALHLLGRYSVIVLAEMIVIIINYVILNGVHTCHTKKKKDNFSEFTTWCWASTCKNKIQYCSIELSFMIYCAYVLCLNAFGCQLCGQSCPFPKWLKSHCSSQVLPVKKIPL